MNNLVYCSRCRNNMINEEYLDHLCEPRINEFKKVKFTSYCIVKNSQGKTLVDITSLDGVSYLFEEVPENKKMTKIPYQPIVNTNNNSQEDNRIIL